MGTTVMQAPPNQAMKKCAYCGRENPDGAEYCRECGTRFATPSDPKEAAQARDRTWLEWLGLTLGAIGMLLAVGLLYLLSFGPVEHYCVRTISQSAPPATFTTNGQTVTPVLVRRVSYPLWVGVVYRPALMLRGNPLYRSYLEWWSERP